MKTAMILTLVWHSVFGQQSINLPGVASLFEGFGELVSGPCKVTPDGCLNFFEGWYMHNGIPEQVIVERHASVILASDQT